MVFYRKYRPQTITDLDSSSLREKLQSVLANPEASPHAYLFTGPKGLGKTSTARIVAKVINCEKNSKLKTKNSKIQVNSQKLDINDQRLTASDHIEPCNECEQCTSITNGTNMDVIEIDAASNRGIDEIRDLKEKVKLSPLSATKKVYIIDEVHMLTTEAFNALLKTLEEPPGHVVFVLCTTESAKIPATILSRCTHIMFMPATNEELVRSFERIVKGEKLSVSGEVLLTIADLSDSGFRDGTKILEELVYLANDKKITKELVEERYKSVSIKYQVQEMLEALTSQDTKAAIVVVERLLETGVDVKYFLLQFLEMLHSQLLISVGIGQAGDKKYAFTGVELQYLLSIFSKAAGEMKFAVLPQIPFELAVVEWGGVERSGAQKKSDADITPSAGEVAEVEVSTQTVTMKTLRKNLGTMAKIKALYGEDQAKQNLEEKVEVRVGGVSLLEYDANGDTKAWMDNFWRTLISEMKTYNHTLAGVLRGCHLKSYDKKTLVIESMFKFHKEKLDEGKAMEALEKICKALTGNSVRVSVVLRAK